MHHVDRGAEPEELPAIRARLTPRWIAHYRLREGATPADRHWLRFHERLRRAFNGLCAFCEEACQGEVEHFRPKHLSPELVYEWTNWLFSCHDCNHAKGAKWRETGYVDPCADSEPELPEQYFSFDIKSGEIRPKPGLDETRRQRAQSTIDDLGLNAPHQLQRRLSWIETLSVALSRLDPREAIFTLFISRVTSREERLSSLTRELLCHMGIPSSHRSSRCRASLTG